MKLTTAIENVKFYAYHGLYDFEHQQGGEFMVNVFIDEEIDDHANLNNINNLINYEIVYTIVSEEMNNTRHMIEDVANSILQRICKMLINKKACVTVKINKINPAGKFGSGSASVSLNL